MRLNDSGNMAVANGASEYEDKKSIVYQKQTVVAKQGKNTKAATVLAYDNLRDKAVLYPDGIERYEMKETDTTADTNRASILAYGTGLNKIISDYPFYDEQSPTEITLNAYKSGVVYNDLAKLAIIKLNYENRADDLLALSVPKELGAAHINLINSFDRIAQLAKNMEQVGTDNLLALNSARQYVEESNLVLSILAQLNGYFEDKNVDLGDKKISLKVDVIN